MARDSSLYLSQPSSSQSTANEAVERAFWQSTPTALEQLRQRTHDVQAPVPDDQARPEDPLRLSTEQSRLIRQTWISLPPAGTVCGLDGETRTSSQSSGRHGLSPGGTGLKISDVTAGAGSCPDLSIFRHIKNIEKVCRTVDERIQKRKIQKEWTTKIISETERLRRREENADDMHDNATLDDHLGTQRSTEVVPTSQSQERYLSLSCPSQTAPTGFLDVPCAPIDNDHVDPSQASESRIDVVDVLPEDTVSGAGNGRGITLPVKVTCK